MPFKIPVLMMISFLSLSACEDEITPVGEAIKNGSFDLTLSDYKAGTENDRLAFITAYVSSKSLDANDVTHYVSCMGDYAANKSETLKFEDVFEWCARQAEINRDAFVSHFNELDAEDLSSMASVHCTNLVTDRLTDPASADFPFFDKRYFSRGEQRYIVKSYVDAKNAFGGQVRLNWHCDIQYRGAGDTADERSWTLHDLEMLQ